MTDASPATAGIRRGRGRPPVGGAGERTVRFDLRLPESVHAALVAEAARLGVSLGDLVRRKIAQVGS